MARGHGYLCNSSLIKLGDGRGWVNQTINLRQDYSSPDLGTCRKSFIGGNLQTRHSFLDCTETSFGTTFLLYRSKVHFEY
jgi:hypothetical protein